MSYTTSEMSPADIRACTEGGNGGNSGWGFGGDGWWIILLFLFAGWGGRGFGNGFGGGGGGGGCGCSPCATQADVRAAVDQQTLISKIDQQTYGLSDVFNSLNTNLNNNFRGIDNAICTLGYQGAQHANDISRQLADCCCKIETGIDRGFAATNYNLATQSCETRNTIQNTTRDLIDNQNANARAILDALTAQRIADKDERIAAQQQRIFALELAASQANQNAVLRADMEANTATILRRTGAECPTAAYLVQPPTPVNFPVNGCGQVQFGGNCNHCNPGGSF